MTKDRHSNSATNGEQSSLMPVQEALTAHSSRADFPSVSENESASVSARPGSAYSVEVQVEELILHGFASGDRQRIGESFETEMNRLFIDHGAPPSLIQGGEIAMLNDLEFNLAASTRPEAIGTHLARVIFRSLSQ